jgi:hypothetical protein
MMASTAITTGAFTLSSALEFPVLMSAWADYAPREITSESERVAGWDKAIRIMHTMLSLSDDWDGMGAIAPSRDIVFSALELGSAHRASRDFPAPTRVTATPSGTIGLEWQQPSVYTEVEIVASREFDWMQIKDGEPAKHWTDDGVRDTDLVLRDAPVLGLTFERISWPNWVGSLL